MSFAAKPVSPAQIPALAALAKEIWFEYFPVILSHDQIDYMVRKFQSEDAIRHQIQDGYLYFFLQNDGHTIGYCGVHPENGKLFLSKLYLKKDFRGKGFATCALSFLQNLARSRDLHAIWLTVNRHNDIAIRAYQKNAFTVVREQNSDIGNGFFMDDFVMELSLLP